VTEFPPSTSQPDLAVPGEPTSEMVEDKRKPNEHAAFDTDINKEFPLALLDLVIGVERQLGAILLSLLVDIAQQNNHTIDLMTAANMMKQKEHKWLRDFLIGKWRDRSFMEARRLSECPLLYLPRGQVHVSCFPSRNPSTCISQIIFTTTRFGDGWSW
jgi:hypothetical protein